MMNKEKASGGCYAEASKRICKTLESSSHSPNNQAFDDPPVDADDRNFRAGLHLTDDCQFAVFPVQSRGMEAKRPFPGFKWKDRATSGAGYLDICVEFEGGAPAIDCGKSNLLVIDVDVKDGKAGGIGWDGLCLTHGDPHAPVVRTPSGGVHIYFRQPSDCEPLGNGTGRLPKGIDVRGVGGYVLGPGAIVEAGPYALESGDLAHIPVVPDWLYDILRPAQPVSKHTSPDAVSARLHALDREGELARVSRALSFIPAHDRETWVKVGMALKAAFGNESGRTLWDEWSEKSYKFEQTPGDQDKIWTSFAHEGRSRRRIALGTIFHLAKKHGWKQPPQGSPGETAEQEGFEVINAGDVKPEKVDWLWPDTFAYGKLGLIAGDPGGGKSQITIDIAATVTTGGAWPVHGERCERGKVALLSAEDGVADTIVPRFLAAGGDPSMLDILQGIRARSKNGTMSKKFFDLSADLAQLEHYFATNPQTKLLGCGLI